MKEMPTLTELIAKCDDAEISTQNLISNLSGMEIKKSNGFITFITDPNIVKSWMLGKPDKIGIVVWLPQDVFERS
jgi:hypothetical protein